MPTCIALFRGINVGRAKRVAMADLRALLKGLGFTEVRTLLNSGNVVFTDPRSAKGDSAARIESALASELHVTARVFVFTAEELHDVVAGMPLAQFAENPSRAVVTFIPKPADLAKLLPLLQQDWSPEALALGHQAVYAWCPNGVLESPLNTAIARLLKDGGTARNWATVLKLESLVADAEDLADLRDAVRAEGDGPTISLEELKLRLGVARAEA